MTGFSVFRDNGRVTPKKALAVMNDLFFSVKILDAGKQAGIPVEIVKDREKVLAKAADASVVIFDLNYGAIDPVDLIQTIKRNPSAPMLVGFVSHVQTELIAQARDSGCDVVVARSAFAQRLPAILSEAAARS
jgi:CheY-like chemotaxis protein